MLGNEVSLFVISPVFTVFLKDISLAVTTFYTTPLTTAVSMG